MTRQGGNPQIQPSRVAAMDPKADLVDHGPRRTQRIITVQVFYRNHHAKINQEKRNDEGQAPIPIEDNSTKI